MKKSLYFGLIAVLGLVGCTRNQEIDISDANLSLVAKTESSSDSRTIVEGGVHVYWEPGDEIMVFTGEKSAKFTTDIAASSASATFKGTFGEETWPEDMDLWAVYPYSEEAVFDRETITTVLPSEQVARAGSFGKDMNLAVAHSTGTTLQFYNVGGGIRFSVMEEGIKKVMFEGLGGEIISGKVKIGFENGSPVVQEVSNGSQFITLLPPKGSDTFEKDTWYYIVAIPGALEGGYKLRFYKDSDYARKVSEKAVEIKRSIYGNIEKADEGIEYEVTTTHFPVTEEEISESVDLTYEIGDDVSVILRTTYDRNAENLEEVALEIEKVTGVQRVDILSSKKTIAVMQRDSIWLNFFLDSDAFYDKANVADETPTIETSSLHTKNKSVSRINSDLLDEENSFTLVGRKALVLQPFYTDANNHEYEMLDDYYEVKHIKDNQSSLAHFKGDYLDDFDVILIETHGGTTYRMYDPEVDDGIGNSSETTSFSTHVMYSKELAEMIIKAGSLSRDQVAITFIEDENGTYHPVDDETKHYSPVFAMTPDFLEGANFNNTIVYLNTCHSGEQIGDRPFGDMVPAFLDKGAGIVACNNDTVKQKTSYHCVYNFIKMLIHGISFQDAYKSIITSYDVRLFCNTYWDYIKNNEGIKPEDQRYVQIYDRLLYKMNDDINANHFFLFNAVPHLSSVNDGTLKWECSLDSFSTTWPINATPKYDLVVDYTVSYDVYVDRNKYATVDGNSEKSVSYSTLGDHKWYVIANVTKHIPSVNSHGEEGYELVASYRSAEMEFTVTHETPKVETFPASVDDGYVFLSGNVTNRSLEGLETGFYYYKMTAEEETMQLFPGDSLRLALSGKTILSAGNYKDYFGVNLTDIEENSKYLFVAYAKDEYDQIGQGRVLAFEVGGGSHYTCETPEAIDLGLPSGIKWASFNLGASKPEEYGDYFAWGETEPYYRPGYALSESPLWKSGKEDGYYWTSYKWCMGWESMMTKYCINPDYGYNGLIDGNTMLDPEDDAAHVILGGKWRMPTDDELKELLNNCRSEWVQVNGKYGRKITGPNGNSIFLPAAGLRYQLDYYSGDLFEPNGTYGLYWGIGLATNSISYDASYLFLNAQEFGSAITLRCFGQSIRPVYDGDSVVPVSSVSINKTKLELSAGESSTLVAAILPENATNKSVSWSSSNESVATVSSSGVVTGVAAGAAFITVTTSDGGKTATCNVTVTESSPPVAIPEAIDLGLPSGLKWASFNLGASKPEEYGDYFAWGETEPYYSSLDPLTWNEGKEAGYGWASYKWCMGDGNKLTKYCSNSSYGYNGFTDTKTVLDIEDDAASVSLGGKWRMPTDVELTELWNNCTWEWTSMNGIEGQKVIGPNGNSIFLPATGYRIGTSLFEAGYFGDYWSSSLHTDSHSAWGVYFDSGYLYRVNFSRSGGGSVRPVSE